MTGHATNEGVGAAQSKTGDMATPLNRGMGLSATMGAMGSKTRSPHNAAGGPAYDYQDVGGASADEHLVGYETGNGGASDTPAGTHG